MTTTSHDHTRDHHDDHHHDQADPRPRDRVTITYWTYLGAAGVLAALALALAWLAVTDDRAEALGQVLAALAIPVLVGLAVHSAAHASSAALRRQGLPTGPPRRAQAAGSARNRTGRGSGAASSSAVPAEAIAERTTPRSVPPA